MADIVNTDIAALQEIKNSLIEFRETITPLKSRIFEYLDNKDYQIKTEYERKCTVIEERHRKSSEEGKTDSFACDTCGGRIMLKIIGDTTHCRENGCSGTLHRVYLDNCYSPKYRQQDIQELKDMKESISKYSTSKDEFINILKSFFTSEMDGLDSTGDNLSKCINILEEYLGTEMDNTTFSNEEADVKKNLILR